MEEYLDEINLYLPIEFLEKDENDFILYLNESYLENYSNGKFQFSFICFHLLNMVFIYKVKWFLKNQKDVGFEKYLNQYIKDNHKRNNTEFNTLFQLSTIPEKLSLSMLLKSLKFHPNDIKNYSFNIDARDNCAHASGKIYYRTPEKIHNLIKEELEFIEKIQEKLDKNFGIFLGKFIEENWNKELVSGDIDLFTKENFLSKKDLELITTINIPLLNKKSNNEKIVKQKLLYLRLILNFQKIISSENNLFLEKLPMIMDGLPKEIVIKDEDLQERKITPQEIIEPIIMSLIGDFSDEDKIEVQKILKLI